MLRRITTLAVVVLGIGLTSCTTQREFISQTPQTTREAFVGDDYVTVVTKTTITRDQWDNIIKKTRDNREEGSINN